MDGRLLKLSYDFLNNLNKSGLKISNIRIKIISRNSNLNGGSYLSFSDLSTFYEKYKSILSSRIYLSLYGDFLIIENFSLTNVNLNFKNSYNWYNITQSKKLNTQIQYDEKRNGIYDKEIQRYLDLMNKSIDEYTLKVKKEIIIRLKLVNTTLPSISGTSTLGSVLTTTNGTWNNIPTSFVYQWRRGNTSVGTNSNTYTLVLADSIANITCVVTAINTKGSVTATSNIITANNYSPVNVYLPAISGVLSLGSILTTTNGIWNFNPTFVYQWKRNSTNIGINTTTYTLVSADAGQNISCEIIATNPVGTGTAAVPVQIPFYTVAPVISGDSTVGSVLTTTNGTWNNTPSIFTYQWYRGLVAITNETASTYTLVQADGGQNIFCVVASTNPINPSTAPSNIIYVFDFDARTFITNAGITNTTQKSAINTLVVSLKSDGLWTKMLAIYPFVGDSASQHKFNLKNPLDTDLAYRLSFVGGWTHSSTGALPNGTNAFADSYFVPSISWTPGDSSISAYSRTDNQEAGGLWGAQSQMTSGAYTIIAAKLNDSTNQNSILHNSSAATPFSNTLFGSALNLMTSRINTTQHIVARNNSYQPITRTEAATLPSVSIYFASRNGTTTNHFSTRQLAFAHIGTGLSQPDMANLYNFIQTFQTTLGRQV